jgi:hypothetical protein
VKKNRSTSPPIYDPYDRNRLKVIRRYFHPIDL